MTHGGNDIVSLQAINRTRTRQPRFYSKILADSELTLYKEGGFAAIPFEIFVWLCWSIKESAFKYLQRNSPTLIFSPTRLVVNLSLPLGYSETKFGESFREDSGFDDRMVFKGIVSNGTDTLFSRSLVYHELIHSVVLDQDNFENTSWGIKLIDQPDPENQSMEVRKFLVDRLESSFPGGKFIVGKNTQGHTVVLQEGKEAEISVSLSHHDRMVAYVFSGSPTHCPSLIGNIDR